VVAGYRVGNYALVKLVAPQSFDLEVGGSVLVHRERRGRGNWREHWQTELAACGCSGGGFRDDLSSKVD
jgi:hypothetical protein